MKSDKLHKKNSKSDDTAIKKLDSIIEHTKNENEALKKILVGLEKMNNKEPNIKKDNKKKKNK